MHSAYRVTASPPTGPSGQIPPITELHPHMPAPPVGAPSASSPRAESLTHCMASQVPVGGGGATTETRPHPQLGLSWVQSRTEVPTQREPTGVPPARHAVSAPFGSVPKLVESGLGLMRFPSMRSGTEGSSFVPMVPPLAAVTHSAKAVTAASAPVHPELHEV